MDSASSSNNSRGFLKLPPELRVQIYEAVLRIASFDPNAPQSPPLLTVYKLTRREAWPVYEASLTRCMSHYRMTLNITSKLVLRAHFGTTSFLELFKLLQVLKACVRVGMEHEMVYAAEYNKLRLGAQLGEGFTFERKMKMLTE